MCYSDWSDWIVQDTARVVVERDLEVSFLSPSCTPRVLDNGVCLSVLDTESNSKSTVVELFSDATLKNSTSVELEGHFIGGNGNGGWSLGNGVFKS